MTTDITFCANGLTGKCSELDKCKRAHYTGDFTESWFMSYADFEPEKGRACKGYLAPLSLKPLEDK